MNVIAFILCYYKFTKLCLELQLIEGRNIKILYNKELYVLSIRVQS